MPKDTTSFAYRASQWVLDNRNNVYCKCAVPDVEYITSGKFKGGAFCYECKGILTKEILDDINELSGHRSNR